MDPNEFLREVISMRDAQRSYDKSQTQLRLREKTAKELKVDQLIECLRKPETKPQQGAMFE